MSPWDTQAWAGLICVLSIALAPVHARSSDSERPLLRAPDHVLVWSQRPDVAEPIFESLGFNVRPGHIYPEGITASTITFGDWSYLELLHFSEPPSAADNAQIRAERAFVRQAPGANSFAVQVSDIDEAAAFLKRRGFSVADIVPDIVDPDGPEGPEPPRPASWRDFHFSASPVSGADIFFIQYPPDQPSTPEADARFHERTMHANAARRMSAIWVLVSDLEAEAQVYGRMGFAVGPIVDVDHLNARARIATLGPGAVVLTQSAGLPTEFEVSGRTGPRVIGLSFEVDSLRAAQSFRSHQGRDHAGGVQGPFGRSWLVPLARSMGLFVEFHEAQRAAE